MIPRSEEERKRRLEQHQAQVLTDALIFMGQVQSSLTSAGLGLAEIETLHHTAMDLAVQKHHVEPDGGPRTGWTEQLNEAMVTALSTSTAMVGHIIALRDGVEEETEEGAE